MLPPALLHLEIYGEDIGLLECFIWLSPRRRICWSQHPAYPKLSEITEGSGLKMTILTDQVFVTVRGCLTNPPTYIVSFHPYDNFFEASLLNKVRSRTARAIQKNSACL